MGSTLKLSDLGSRIGIREIKLNFRWEEEDKKIVQEKKTDSGFLYVAMMSAAKYLDNRALAAAETWARESVTWFKGLV